MKTSRTLLILASATLLGLSACASAPVNPPAATPPPAPQDKITVDPLSGNKVNVEFQGKCAMDVAHGLMTHLGKSEYHVDYKGKTYFFETADERDAFIKNIDTNIKKANLRWAQGQVNLDHDRATEKSH